MLQGDEAKLFKQRNPEYTVRMLLDKTIAEHKEQIPRLKPFSHFTLGCTYADETLKVTQALETLFVFFKGSVFFNVEAVVNLGSEMQPLWGVSLNLGKNEKALRAMFAAQFDSIMCPAPDGVLYLWQPTEGAPKRCSHITIGPRTEDLAVAKKLVELNCIFTFNQIDYKKIGPHDPHISKTLAEAHKTPRAGMSGSQ